mmetsp:Transcript_67041/g.207294  ORF Transcript_67041/g.207294 Transcript_67041/m.207294 type:complete len:229 (+) Transcript_67041:34-720(+)
MCRGTALSRSRLTGDSGDILIVLLLLLLLCLFLVLALFLLGISALLLLLLHVGLHVFPVLLPGGRRLPLVLHSDNIADLFPLLRCLPGVLRPACLREVIFLGDGLAALLRPEEVRRHGSLRRVLVSLCLLCALGLLVILLFAYALPKHLHLLLVSGLVLGCELLVLLLLRRAYRLPDLAGLFGHLGPSLALEPVLLRDERAVLPEPEPVRGHRPLRHAGCTGGGGAPT